MYSTQRSSASCVKLSKSLWLFIKYCSWLRFPLFYSLKTFVLLCFQYMWMKYVENCVFDYYFSTNQCLKAKCRGLIAKSLSRKTQYRRGSHAMDMNLIDYILITNLMHWLLFIHKMLYSSTCFEPQVLIFRRIQLYTCSIRCMYTAVSSWRWALEARNI